MACDRGWGLGLALFSSACFGGSGVLGKTLIHAGLTPLQAVWLRIAGAALILLPLVLLARAAGLRAARGTGRRTGWGKGWGKGRRLAWPLIAYGVTGVAGVQAFYYVAAARLPVGVAILLEFTGPVLVLAWIRFVRRSPVHRSAVVGVAVAVTGLACVVEVWSGLRFDALGLLAGLCAAACQAAYFLMIERLTSDVDPLLLTAAGSTIAVVALSALVAPWSIPWALLPASTDLGGRAVPLWAVAGLLVVVSTVIAYVAGIAAVHRLSAPVAGAVCYTEAVAAILLAWLVLGEHLATTQLAGGAVVLAGAYIAQRAVVHPAPGSGRPVEPVAPVPVTAR